MQFNLLYYLSLTIPDMGEFSILFDILKIAVAGIGVVWFAFYLIKPYLDKPDRQSLVELKRLYTNQTLPLRLQAYERMILFIERINPASMLVRLNAPAFTADELQAIVINEIRTEFQHNVTQQVYVSNQAWAVMRRVKDDTISLITNSARTLPPDASGLELSKIVLNSLGQLEENPYDIASNLIKRELEPLF